jgi:hypothetical protein
VIWGIGSGSSLSAIKISAMPPSSCHPAPGRRWCCRLEEALVEALKRETIHIGAVRQIVDRRRSARGMPPPESISITRSQHADLVTTPHSLAAYDALRKETTCDRAQSHRGAWLTEITSSSLPWPRPVQWAMGAESEKASRTGRTRHRRRRHGHCLRCSSHHQWARPETATQFEASRGSIPNSGTARSASCLDTRFGANVFGPKPVRTSAEGTLSRLLVPVSAADRIRDE